jgi:aspartyl-tRNA(Asn)/glutamyl-tRNA(Gln) amidotransferase subunit C
MVELSEERVRHLAWLARLDLSDEEVARFTRQLAEVLDYFKVLDEADVEGVEPAFHVLGLSNVMGEDEPRPTLSQEEALANAPAKEGGYVKAPAMVV